MVLPLMLYHQLQLLVGTILAGRWSRAPTTARTATAQRGGQELYGDQLDGPQPGGRKPGGQASAALTGPGAPPAPG